MITVVVDYGSGNLHSVAKALERVGASVEVSGEVEVLKRADRLLLPGVGAFADCFRKLQESHLLEPVLDHLDAGRPFLGICVGMQMLMTESYEFGRHPGFDIISGAVRPFERQMRDPADATRFLTVPHMGWNRIIQTDREHPLWRGIPDGAYFYFVHSFYVDPEKPKESVAGISTYGISFAAALARGACFATQFHPEKSQSSGLRFLENFTQWKP